MQERRTTVRVAHESRAQYCAASDLLPCDGRMLNISERGAALLIGEPRREGEQITASFSLPGEEGPVTITGTVRWSSPSRKRRWHTVGLEWLPLEEATRNRLHAFLYAPKPSAEAPAALRNPKSRRSAWGLRAMWAAALIAAAAVAWLWGSTLQQEARRLREGVAQRNAVITTLQQREDQLARREALLQQELGTAKAHLASATGEMARLDQQAQGLAGDAQRLTQEVAWFQQSYDQVQRQRAELIQQVIGLEQERLRLIGRLSSLPELHVAIREAIEARRHVEVEQRRQRLDTVRRTDIDIREGDNQGFIVRDGRPTLSRGTVMWIRVHEPEASR
ncbi:MAG: PilZ domain-containing protein [Candidatus Omnitrophica bacterium]|nr:PilZ domain-containing protein [Candidatus Omnitrophota bacterium]